VPADSASEIVKFTISTPRESCTNAKAKYSSSVVPPGPSVHFYHSDYCLAFEISITVQQLTFLAHPVCITVIRVILAYVRYYAHISSDDEFSAK